MAKAKRKGPGRPTVYDDSMVERVYVLCREAGLSDPLIAKAFNVDRSTINAWKHDHPDFSDALKKGKDEYNNNLVEANLLKRANGFTYTETIKEPVVIKDPADGRRYLADPTLTTTKTIKKTVAPDVTAQIFWLKNRDPNRWRDKRELEIDVPETVIDRISRGRQRAFGDGSDG
jgi:hypothetical protein